jgi:hypothetical protein
MSLRLATAAVLACLVMLAGLVIGQTLPNPPPAPERAVGDPQKPSDTNRIRHRERTGNDANVATGTFGTTGRGTASGAADSKPAEGRRSPSGEETMSDPAGPGSADRRPGTAVTQ